MAETSLVRHIENLNSWNPQNFRPFFIGGHRVGYLKPALCAALQQWSEHFAITDQAVELSASLTNVAQRSEVLEEVAQRLVQQGIVRQYLGESYPVTGVHRDHVLAIIDRSSASYFGIITYGQHLNGFVHTPEGMKMWVARRAPGRIHFPGKLDNIVAGGLPHNLSLQQNLVKECFEEAAMPTELVQQAKSVGAITYCRETDTGLKPDTLYCYDVELPRDFVPRNTDGEVADFLLLPVEEVLRLVTETDEFKLNCNLVYIDFFIRHGLISAEHPEYLELVAGLHG